VPELRPVIDRLADRVEIADSGCWIFTGALRNGYGALGAGPRGSGLVYAHRVAYEHFVGDIPEGLHLDHLCMTRSCVNPAHLEPVTQGENNRRAWAARKNRTAA
jgi:hypothetical protein